jgi:hypothetical protein
MTYTGEITSISEDKRGIYIESETPLKAKLGQQIEYKVVSKKQYEIFLKLLGLWRLLLQECKNQTGNSTEWWAYELKKRAGFGQVIEDSIFIPQSFSYDKSTWKERSDLFTGSFTFLKENEVINLNFFEERYTDITNGKTLNMG